MEQKFNTSLLTGFGPSKLIADLSFEEMTPGFDCGGGTYKITSGEVEKFKKLMGDTNAYPAGVVPVGMIYIFGLRICWDRKVFIDGAIRAGDKIAFYQPAKVGDTITTKLSIADKKEVTKDDKVRRYLYIDMKAANQNGEKITDIQMSFLMPVKK
jgi:hypothetical protein